MARSRVLTYVDKKLRAHISNNYKQGEILEVKLTDHEVKIINIYRPPHTGTIHVLQEKIYNIEVRGTTVIGGDFNATDEMWQSWGESKTPDRNIAEWIRGVGLKLLNEPNVPTHNKGNVLDLALSNMEGAVGEVMTHLHTGSDHQTIGIEIPGRRNKGGVRFAKLEDDSFRERVRARIPDAWVREEPRSPEELDERAEGLVRILDQERGKKTTSGAPANSWWNEEINEAMKRYKATRSAEDREAWHKLISKGKARYWQEKIEGADTPRKAFDLAQWRRRRT